MHTTLVEYTLASTSVLCIILSLRNVIGSIHFLPVPHVTLRIYRRLVDSFIRVKPIANMYPWGKTPFPAEKMPAILLGAGVAAGLLLYAAGGFVLAGSPAADTETGALDMRKLRGVMFATLLMAMLLEGGLGTQVMVNAIKGLQGQERRDECGEPRLLQQPRARNPGHNFHLDPRRASQRQHGRGAWNYVCCCALHLWLPLWDVRRLHHRG